MHCSFCVRLTSALRPGETLKPGKLPAGAVARIGTNAAAHGEPCLVVSGNLTASDAVRALKAAEKLLPDGVRIADQCFTAAADPDDEDPETGFGIVRSHGSWHIYSLSDLALASGAASMVFGCAARESDSGFYLGSLSELCDAYGSRVKKLTRLITFILSIREGVAEAELTRDSIGTAFLVTLYTDYTENGGV